MISIPAPSDIFRSTIAVLDLPLRQQHATLYGETLEIMDYSPEINTSLKVICSPTFQGHCGCILFDLSEIKFTRTSSDTGKALALHFGTLMPKGAEPL